MCPNCNRGLTEKKEVCEVCGGTGFWNPASLTIEETNKIMSEDTVVDVPAEEVVVTEPEVAPEGVPEVAQPEEAAPAEEAAPVVVEEDHSADVAAE